MEGWWRERVYRGRWTAGEMTMWLWMFELCILHWRLAVKALFLDQSRARESVFAVFAGNNLYVLELSVFDNG